mmetsp:Transcript_57160/g.127511  ORF Transcript_57160/g.127511 Transcript_57160/m.127511 type:complete len:605 (+) Transcript_57160:65-1879(+)
MQAGLDMDAPQTPRKTAGQKSQMQRSPLLFIPSPNRRRSPPATPEPAELGATVSSLNADAREFVPSSLAQVPTALRVRELPKPQSPAVLKVRKMSNKGCAVVTLGDRSVMELASRMAVAVIDGVCVEVRRHSRRSRREERGEEEELGVFVAWGHRVERRATISEEGLEKYFNGLAGLAEPANIVAQPPFEERLQIFPISSALRLPLLAPQVLEASQTQLLDGPHGRRDLVQQLWDTKARLDAIWNRPPPPMARSVMQRVARDQLFPHSGKEGKEHENRAGEKLEELAQAVGLLQGVTSGATFLDLCGGPGAWSQYLLAKKFRGFGFTLRSGSGAEEDWQAEQKDDWYPDLLRHPQWQPLWGADGTGDLLKPENLHHMVRSLKRAGGVFLCLADGGFSDKAIPPNLLELHFYRLLLAEILTAASCLQPGGRFVCKLYSSFSASTSALLFLTTKLFDSVHVVKPMSSRIAGPERYLVASGFKEGPDAEAIRRTLLACQNLGDGRSPLQVPLLSPVVSAEEMCRDPVFLPQLRNMVVTLAWRQATALQAILDRAGDLEDMALEVAEEARAATAKKGHEEDIESMVRRVASPQAGQRQFPARAAWGFQ